jgi:dTDP-4-amino-4,6-dideoxygalactose transaminase
MIRLTIPSIEDDDLKAVAEALVSGYLVQGPRVEAFENAISSYVGAKHAIAVSNGTAALHLALLGLGVEPGDIVVVTAYSFMATANVIELCGARPVFVDIRPDTYNIDPAQLEQALLGLMANGQTRAKVKAIMPVHTFGQLADMPSILELAEQHGLPVVEDAACALGAKLTGRQAGTWGTAGCFSLHPRKAITTGEGGLIITDDGDLMHRLRALRNHGQEPGSDEIRFTLPGLNYRMTEFQAALGVTQMAKLERIIGARRRLSAKYDELLSETSIETPGVLPRGNYAVYQSYVALLPEAAAQERAAIIQHMTDREIQTTIGTYHMPMAEFYRKKYGFQPGDFPIADQIFARSITLPLHEYLTEADQVRVVEELRKALGE